MSEAFARVKIDALLRDAGWDLADGASVLFEHALADGTQADYVLCDRQGRPMAALEAKPASVDPIAAQDQGRHYAERLGVPFVFLSNGEEVRFLDREADAHAREIAGKSSRSIPGLPRTRNRLHGRGRRPPRGRRADRAHRVRQPVERPAPRPGGRRHQGRPVRARAAADRAGGRAGPVPHPAPRHPRCRPAGRSADRRDDLRSGGGNGGLPGRRLGPYPARQLFARRDQGDRRRRQDDPTRTRRRPEPRRCGAVAGSDVLRSRRGPADGPPRHHESDAARAGPRAHRPAATRSRALSTGPQSQSLACRRAASMSSSQTRRFRVGWTGTASSTT